MFHVLGSPIPFLPYKVLTLPIAVLLFTGFFRERDHRKWRVFLA
jgi:hypothetical protein